MKREAGLPGAGAHRSESTTRAARELDANLGCAGKAGWILLFVSFALTTLVVATWRGC